ncbi:MAG: hypothetical protein Q4D54_04500 [Eubacteriales bacterium]|nr:hypothetical protein [Eubacteriales bacterium]
MRKTHTIYMPQMLYYHNDLLCAAFAFGGYKLKVVPEYPHHENETASLINKDYCTCATGIIGNILCFLKDAACDPDKVAFLEPQAGGACRAGNYYNLIIECLHKIGYDHIPVISLNYQGKEKHNGFRINARMLMAAVAAVCYSDLLMTLVEQIRPYECNAGEADRLREKWIARLSDAIAHGKKIIGRKKIYDHIIRDFQKIKTEKKELSKVGIVGEIYIKYSPIGNCHLEDFLRKRDCDYRQGGFLNYCIYVVYSDMKNKELLRNKKIELAAYQKVIDFLCNIQKGVTHALRVHGMKSDGTFGEMTKIKEEILSEYYNIGDGWLMAAEAIDLIHQGYNKILIVHPFGCLVSHVGGRGVIKAIKDKYPDARITSIEYDYDQSKTLRESRLLLAIS